MNEIINIYCDESGHLENDRERVMVLGAIWCPEPRARHIARRIRDIKAEFGFSPNFEVKWKKVSKGKKEFYLRLMRYFFDEPGLHFRALIVPDKSKLRHEYYGHDHDTWYYKMYFNMLKAIFETTHRFRIYLDIKDTCGEEKRRVLHDVICCSRFDFQRSIIERLQCVRSEEVQQIQLADLLIGTVSYANRQLAGNEAKVALMHQMQSLSGYSLTRSTFLRETKVNLFRWRPREEPE